MYKTFARWYQDIYGELDWAEYNYLSFTYKTTPAYRGWLALGQPLSGQGMTPADVPFIPELPKESTEYPAYYQKFQALPELYQTNLLKDPATEKVITSAKGVVAGDEPQAELFAELLNTLTKSGVMSFQYAQRIATDYMTALREGKPFSSEVGQYFKLATSKEPYSWSIYIQEEQERQRRAREEYITLAQNRMQPFLEQQAFKRATGFETPGERQEYLASQSHLIQQQRVEEQQRQTRFQKAEQAWLSTIGEMTSYQQAAAPFIERLGETVSPAGQEYFQQHLPSMFSEMGMPQRRKAWWRQKTAWPGMPPTTRGAVGTEEEAETEAELQEWEAGVKSQLALPDPWVTALQHYPFLERFKALTPSQRGEYPARFAPPARWV